MTCLKCNTPITTRYCYNCGAFNPMFNPSENSTANSQYNTQYTSPNYNYPPRDGYYQNNSGHNQPYDNRQAGYQYFNESPKSKLAALLFCVFLGVIGVHRFYVGKIGTGILYLFTGGLFGVGVLIDFILIVINSFTDSDGNTISQWGV